MQALQRRQESAGMAGLGGVAGHDHGSGTFNLSGNVKLPANYGNPSKSGWRAPSGGWGGAYGLIPEAGAAWERLDAAFKKTFGYKIPVNSAFRSYAREKELWDLYQSGRGNLASRPGGSVHERGFAIDLGGAFQNASSKEHKWLQVNAGRFGWNWAGKNFSQFEPWHWEYRGAR
jgi:hypothetical protein